MDAEIMHGDVCFVGTRVPLSILLDWQAEGIGLEEFLESYPSVSRDHAKQVLLWEREKLREAVGFRLAG